MWRGLDRSFTRALGREGVPVQDTAGIYTKVLFRRKRDNADGGDWLDAYTRQEDGFIELLVILRNSLCRHTL